MEYRPGLLSPELRWPGPLRRWTGPWHGPWWKVALRSGLSLSGGGAHLTSHSRTRWHPRLPRCGVLRHVSLGRQSVCGDGRDRTGRLNATRSTTRRKRPFWRRARGAETTRDESSAWGRPADVPTGQVWISDMRSGPTGRSGHGAPEPTCGCRGLGTSARACRGTHAGTSECLWRHALGPPGAARCSKLLLLLITHTLVCCTTFTTHYLIFASL